MFYYLSTNNVKENEKCSVKKSNKTFITDLFILWGEEIRCSLTYEKYIFLFSTPSDNHGAVK